jgi:hypothetical protein
MDALDGDLALRWPPSAVLAHGTDQDCAWLRIDKELWYGRTG